MNKQYSHGEKAVWLFRNFLPSGTYFTKQITVTHKKYFYFTYDLLGISFYTFVYIFSDRRLFVHKGNLYCMSELQFSWNLNYTPTKHSSWWRRLQDVLIKTNIFALVIRLQKTSSRRLGQDQYIRLVHTSSRRLQDVFKTSSRRLAKTSSRHLQDVFKTSCKDIFKTFSRRIIKLNCSY